MKKGLFRKLKLLVLELLMTAVLAALAYGFLVKSIKTNVSIDLVAKVVNSGDFELFYVNKGNFSPQKSIQVPVKANLYYQKISFEIPEDSFVSQFRIDPGKVPGSFAIKEIIVRSYGAEHRWTADEIQKGFFCSADLIKEGVVEGEALFNITGEDPYLFIEKDISGIYKKILESPKGHYEWPRVWTLIIAMVLWICIRISGASEKLLEMLIEPSGVLVAFFLVLLSIPFLNMNLHMIPEVKNHEKRTLAPKPEFSVEDFKNFTSKYTIYFNDHFGLKSLMVKINSYFKIGLLYSNPNPHLVTLGKEYWLYIPEKSDQSYTLNPYYDENQLKEIEQNVLERSRRLKALGIDYYLIVVPEKSEIYPEYLPEIYKDRNVHARMDQLYGMFQKNKDLTVIDVRKELLEAKRIREVYYSSDAHWNHFGAMVAYEKLMNTIEKDHPEINHTPITDFQFVEGIEEGGDLSTLANVPELFPMHEYYPVLKGQDKIYMDKYLNIAEQKIQKFSTKDSVDSKKKKVFLVHDSFGLYFTTPLMRDFREGNFVWTNFFNEEFVKKEQPDVVIHQLVCRFSLNLRHP